jgi:hypothetical protein
MSYRVSMREAVALLAVFAAACGTPSGAAPDRAEAGAVLTMPVTRAAHSAVARADGRVLLIGGCVRESCEAGPESSTVDAFDLASKAVEPAGKLLGPRVSTTTAMLPGGRVLIAGGWAGSSVTGSTEIFDPAAGSSRAGPDLSSPKADMAVATLRDGRVLLAGGYDGRNAVGTIDLFDPRDNSLKSIGSLSIARAGAGAALLPDGRVLVVGGGVNGASGLRATATAEIIDPATGASRPTGSLADARYKHAVLALNDGRVIAIGGSDERDSRGKLDTIEIFDAATGRFAPAGRMLASRYKIGSAVALLGDGRILIAGGAPRAEVYDPATGRSTPVGPEFGGSLNFASATRLASGAVLVAGGYYEDGIRMSRRAWLVR